MEPGTSVTILGPALQDGLPGVVVDAEAVAAPGHEHWTECGYVLVQVEPDAEGLYGGRYWFRSEELRPAEATG